MLYDPKWEKTTKAEPLSLEHFIGWLETKNPSDSYVWAKCDGKCAVDQYLKAINVGRHQTYKDMPLEDLAIHHPHTFGALLKRARAAR